MKTVGVRHLSVPDKSYQNHCCYLTQYPPSNTHHQYYFRQLEHCVNIRGNIFCDTDFFCWPDIHAHPTIVRFSFIPFAPCRSNPGKVPFSAGLKPTKEKRCSELFESLFCIEHTLSIIGIIFQIWSQLTLSFMMLILLISHCARTGQSCWLLCHCPHHSLSTQYYSWNTSDIEFLAPTNYPPIIQRDTLRTISGNSN